MEDFYSNDIPFYIDGYKVLDWDTDDGNSQMFLEKDGIRKWYGVWVERN